MKVVLELKVWITEDILFHEKQSKLLEELHCSRNSKGEAEAIIMKYLPNMKYNLFSVSHAVDNHENTNFVILEAVNLN